MKKIICLFAAAVVMASIAVTTQAQTIAWGSAQNMVGDSDVLTNGTDFDAITFHNSAVTVNGVTFNSASSGSDGTISVTTPNGGIGAYGSAFTTTSPSSTAYSHLTDTIAFVYFTIGTVTIADLTAGDNYQVQVWAWYPQAGNNANPTLTGNNSVTLSSTTGQFAVGTFTAGSSTETFNYQYGAQYGTINAISVRDTTIPEPSAWAMMAGGLGMLFAGQRIRRSTRKI